MYQIESIADIVQAAGIATLGSNLFLYHSPAEVNSCIIIYPSNDPPAIDPDVPGYFTGKFQTIVRDSQYDSGIALCQLLSNSLTRYNLDTKLMFIKVVRPLYQARIYRRGDGGMIEFSVTYEIRFIAK